MRIVANGGKEVLPLDEAVFLHVKVGHLKAFALEVAHRIEHCLVFGLHRNEVAALVAVEVRGALDGEVVGFGSAGREDDLARIRADERSDVGAGLFNGLLRFPAVGMAVRGRVAEVNVEVGHHLFHDAGIARGRGGVVEVNRKLHF